mgnify:CR=1 FL=1
MTFNTKRYFNLNEKFGDRECIALNRLIEIFTKYNKSIYLVGGCVRDLLLDRPIHDIDLTTNATPEEMIEMVNANPNTFHLIETGIKHGTVTFYEPNYKISFEVTTFRLDSDYTDHRHPDKVAFTTSLEEDLKRRDLTINSFAYDLFNNDLIMLDESYMNDIDLGIIRCVGNAEDRFNEDALRMLRALRFSAQLNFSIAVDTYNAIKKGAPLIADISKERIKEELTKIILSDNPQILELFVITGLEKDALRITPISDILNCPHDNPWHYTDVFHHTMDVIKKVPKTFNLRWAALFHDFGKPHVKRLKEGTTNHYNYHGHPDISADIALKLMEELKFSNEQSNLIYKYVKYHDLDLVECKNSKFKTILVDIGVDNFKDFAKLKFADASAHCLSKNTKYAVDYIDKLYERFSTTVIENQALTLKDLDINGYDLIELGYQGIQIGTALKECLDFVLENPDKNTKDILIKECLKIDSIV